jgi:hypothetical protein
MGDLKFSCPHCNQHITCDELWGGHQLQCPSCQGTLTVPARPEPAAPAPVPASSGGGLVPKPPSHPSPRLSLGQAQGASASAAGGSAHAPPRTIPIRNLAPPPPKKTNRVLKILGTTATVLVIVAGGVFGFLWIRQIQAKANEKSRAEDARNSGESQVGHIANLNSVLDATEPGHSLGELSERRSTGPRQRPSGVGQQIELGGNSGSAMPADSSPVVSPVYTLDLASARIPDGHANGSISGSNFVAETARIDPVGSAHVLRLLQGQLVSPDREVLVYLHLKPGETLGGQTLNISTDMKGTGVPQVSKRWKLTPQSAPSLRAFNTGYAMKLQLGTVTNGFLDGKIFLALPDAEQTVVAGAFKASIIAAQAVQMNPAMAPTRPATDPAQSATDRRYGIRR